MNIEIERVKKLAQAMGIEIAENVFHGAEVVELRVSRDNLIHCIGFIFGPAMIEFYSRQLSKSEERIRNRFWFLTRLFKLRHDQGKTYIRLATWSYDDFATIDLESIIRNKLA